MKKILKVLVLSLFWCNIALAGSISVEERFEQIKKEYPQYNFLMVACPTSKPNDVNYCSLAATDESLIQTKELAINKCKEINGSGSNCFISKVATPALALSYGSSYSGEINTNKEFLYNTNKEFLYYDKSSGAMRPCAHESPTGQCFAFKLFNPKSYNKDTLFYNPKTKSMQPCLAVSATGRCRMFGVFNSQTTSENQLFYDPRNNKMTTCSHVMLNGSCAHYDLVPKNTKKLNPYYNNTGYTMTSESNPYYKRVPRTPTQLMDVGMNMLMGGCTLGLNC